MFWLGFTLGVALGWIGYWFFLSKPVPQSKDDLADYWDDLQ